MKLANNVKLSVFVKEGENQAEIEEKLKSLVPLDIEKEKIALTKQNATGFNEKKITIIEIALIKDRNINAFLDDFKGKLGEKQKELLIRQKETRLDNEMDFFIRLDKPRLLNGEYWITERGNCFHIKISISAFPKNREKGLETVEKIFGAV
jgi:RNA binding exosome subunit